MPDSIHSSSKGAAVLLPVLFGFFIMGFVDIVGFSNSYVRNDFPGLTETLASLISVSCFVWFLLLSVPAGMLMSRLGRKRMVLTGLLLTCVANLVPLVDYSFGWVLLAFAFIGMGNTLLQVALNPLAGDIVAPRRLTGILTFGQLVKAVSSFLAPILAAALTGVLLGWRTLFALYALLSFLAFLWLLLSGVPNIRETSNSLTLRGVFSLLGQRTVLLFFLGIVILVGVDVGLGITLPKLLQERLDLSLENASMGNSAYFLARSLGAFLGGLILLRSGEGRFYLLSALLALAGLLGLTFSGSLPGMLTWVSLFALGYSNLFAIIFSLTLRYVPSRANEASALLVTGVAGGGVISPLLGALVDATHTQTSALWALVAAWLVILLLSPLVIRRARKD